MGNLQTKPTLARKIGETTHVSPLWRHVLEVCNCPEEQATDWLLKCAILRGAAHYDRELPKDLPPNTNALSDEEVAVALCLGQHPYNSVLIRAAAQLLSSTKIDPVRLVRLAKMERVERVLKHVAEAAKRVDPQLEPWLQVRGRMNSREPDIPGDALPHWSRFVSQTGVTMGEGTPEIRWLRRRETIK